jgi:hypothetical protein
VALSRCGDPDPAAGGCWVFGAPAGLMQAAQAETISVPEAFLAEWSKGRGGLV